MQRMISRVIALGLLAFTIAIVPTALFAADPVTGVNVANNAAVLPGTAAAVSPPLVSWGAVFGGVLVVLTVQLLFSTLGLGLGAAAIDPYDRQNPTKGVPTGALVWFLVSGLVALFVGGWVAGRLSGGTVDQTSVGWLHGLLVWSLSTVTTIVLIATPIGALIGGMVHMVTEGASLVARGAAAVIPGTAGAIKDLAAETLPQFNFDGVKKEARKMLRENSEQLKQAGDQAKQAGQNAVQDPLQADEELSTLLNSLYGKVRDGISNGEKEELVNTLASRTGKKKEDIQKTLENWEKAYGEAKRKYEVAMKEAEQKAREVADATAKTVSRIALWSFAALTLGMVVTIVGGRLGLSNPTLFYIW